MSRDTDNAPDPETIQTVGEFVEALRRVKVFVGDPSYNQLRQRTGIPTSTLADALNPKRAGLPDLELVRNLVHALEIDPAPWEAAWRRIRLADHAVRDAEPGSRPVGPEPDPDQRGLVRRLWHRHTSLRWLAPLLPVAVAALLLGAEVIPDKPNPSPSPEAAHRGATGTSPSTRQSLPGSGHYRIKLAGTDKCASEDPDREQHGLVYMLDCRKTFRVEGVHRITKDIYQIRSRHEKYGVGCLGWNDDQDGAVNETCGTMGELERFRLEPVEGVRNGFRMHVLAGGCVTVGDVPRDLLAPIIRQDCHTANQRQILTLERH